MNIHYKFKRKEWGHDEETLDKKKTKYRSIESTPNSLFHVWYQRA